MYQLIPLQSGDYLQKIRKFRLNKRSDLQRQAAEIKCDNEQTINLD